MSGNLDISDVIKKQIQSAEAPDTFKESGVVISIGDGIASVYGLNESFLGEMVNFESGATGLILSLEENSVGVVIFGSEADNVKGGDRVYRTKRILSVGVGKGLLGRVVNGIGNVIDGKGDIDFAKESVVEIKAPGIMTRKSVNEPLQTGIKSIDSLIPIGRGQRELLIGDRQTGKSTIIIDTILNQKAINDSAKDDKDKMFCIYVAIGQKRSSVAQMVRALEERGAMDYTCIVAATASDSAPEQFLAPYVGCTIGEYFRDNGMHAVIFYDDLSKQAVAYRQVSLLLRRPPGREAYPGDVFYLHSRLLERSAKLNSDYGSGSLTAIPIIETQANDISAYIPTNVISITDGQMFLETGLFNQGIRPAINVGASVSRVGKAAQTSAMKKVSGSIKLDLAEYREIERFSQFASDLDAVTRQQLNRGRKLTELLKQVQYKPMPLEEQVVSIFSGTKGYLDKINVADVLRFEREMIERLRDHDSNILSKIKSSGDFTKEIETDLIKFLDDFSKSFAGSDVNG